MRLGPFTNSITRLPLTNSIVLITVGTTANADGSYSVQGIPRRMALGADGSVTTNILVNNYIVTNSDLATAIGFGGFPDDSGPTVYAMSDYPIPGKFGSLNWFVTRNLGSNNITYNGVTNALGFVPISANQVTNLVTNYVAVSTNSVTTNLIAQISSTSNLLALFSLSSDVVLSNWARLKFTDGTNFTLGIGGNDTNNVLRASNNIWSTILAATNNLSTVTNIAAFQAKLATNISTGAGALVRSNAPTLINGINLGSLTATNIIGRDGQTPGSTGEAVVIKSGDGNPGSAGEDVGDGGDLIIQSGTEGDSGLGNSGNVRIRAGHATVNLGHVNVESADASASRVWVSDADTNLVSSPVTASELAQLSGLNIASTYYPRSNPSNYFTGTITTNTAQVLDTVVSNGLSARLIATNTSLQSQFAAADTVVSNGVSTRLIATNSALQAQFTAADTIVSNGVSTRLLATNTSLQTQFIAADTVVSNGLYTQIQAGGAVQTNGFGNIVYSNANSYWKTVGNTGSNVIGTTDSSGFAIIQNNQYVFRIISGLTPDFIPSLLGGYSGNIISNITGLGAGNVIVSGGSSVFGPNRLYGSASFMGSGKGLLMSNTLDGVMVGGVGNSQSNAALTLGQFSGGGQQNINTAAHAVQVGGLQNGATGTNAVSVGGYGNIGSGHQSVSVGGAGNTASGYRSFSGGGFGNTAADYGMAPGGQFNTAGTNSFAAGAGATASKSFSFVWSDRLSGAATTTTNSQTIFFQTNGFGINKIPVATNAVDVSGNVQATSFGGAGIYLTQVPAATNAFHATNADNATWATNLANTAITNVAVIQSPFLSFTNAAFGSLTNFTIDTNRIAFWKSATAALTNGVFKWASTQYTNWWSGATVSNNGSLWIAKDVSLANLYTSATLQNSAWTIVGGSSPAPASDYGVALNFNGVELIGILTGTNLTYQVTNYAVKLPTNTATAGQVLVYSGGQNSRWASNSTATTNLLGDALVQVTNIANFNRTNNPPTQLWNTGGTPTVLVDANTEQLKEVGSGNVVYDWGAGFIGNNAGAYTLDVNNGYFLDIVGNTIGGWVNGLFGLATTGLTNAAGYRVAFLNDTNGLGGSVPINAQFNSLIVTNAQTNLYATASQYAMFDAQKRLTNTLDGGTWTNLKPASIVSGNSTANITNSGIQRFNSNTALFYDDGPGLWTALNDSGDLGVVKFPHTGFAGTFVFTNAFYHQGVNEIITTNGILDFTNATGRATFALTASNSVQTVTNNGSAFEFRANPTNSYSIRANGTVVFMVTTNTAGAVTNDGGTLTANALISNGGVTGAVVSATTYIGPVLTNNNNQAFVIFTNNLVSLNVSAAGVFTWTNYSAASQGFSWLTNGALISSGGFTNNGAMQVGTSSPTIFPAGGGATFQNNVSVQSITESGSGNVWIKLGTTIVHLGDNGTNTAGLNVEKTTGKTWVNGNFIVTNTITATNGVIFYQGVNIPTNSIPASSSGITNYVELSISNNVHVGPCYVATNTAAAGSFLILKPGGTIVTYP